jgi:FkbM family methyltransferase
MSNAIKEAIAQLERSYATLHRELDAAQFQMFLEGNLAMLLNRMGVGSGHDVRHSGERAVIELVFRRARGSCCIFDVGANRGQFAQLALETAGAAPLELHCFEPGEAAYALLARSFANSRAVRLNRFAIGDTPGERPLFYDAPGSELASLFRRRLGHFGLQFDKQETVPVETIDNYCARNGIAHIDLLKLDVEGNEFAALQGAAATLERGGIDCVSFEFGGTCIDSRIFLQDFFYLFSRYQMRLFRITPSGFLRPIERYHEICEQFMGTNYLAAREGIVPR